MKVRWGLVVVGVGLSVAVLSGCSGAPEPAASTPVFGSEEQAFAAAEQTYRNYVDALNQVDLSDPSTFEEVYRWTTGDANAADRESLSQMHAAGLDVAGTTRAPLVEGVRAETGSSTRVELAVCQDVIDVTLTAPDGASAVDPGRDNVQSRLIVFAEDAQSETKLLITSFQPREGEPSCALQ